jgi:hypothetical protein
MRTRGNGEAAVAAPSANEIAERHTSQALSWRQQRKRFEKVGFAGPMSPDDHLRPSVSRNARRRVATKIRQRQPLDP